MGEPELYVIHLAKVGRL